MCNILDIKKKIFGYGANLIKHRMKIFRQLVRLIRENAKKLFASRCFIDKFVVRFGKNMALLVQICSGEFFFVRIRFRLFYD